VCDDERGHTVTSVYSTYNVAFPRVNDRIFMAFNHKRESQKRETDMITHTVRI
jgi:hypothetical protein